MQVKLTQGKFALIDGGDFHLISNYRWYAYKDKYTFYARANTKINGKRITLLMHRLLVNPKGKEEVDHKNGNGLDNRKENIRVCSHLQNMYNRRKIKTTTSKFKGVCWHKASNKWVAQFQRGHKKIYLGSFKTEKDAALAYNRAIVKFRPSTFIILNKC